MVKSPTSFEEPCWAMLVATLVTLMATPGTTAPVASVTRPTTVAADVCAPAPAASTRPVKTTLSNRMKPPTRTTDNCYPNVRCLAQHSNILHGTGTRLPAGGEGIFCLSGRRKQSPPGD